jgi:hypothetical protein
MTTASGAEESKGQATISTEGRRLIGQAIMDGILAPGEVLLTPRLDYTQQGGNYTQRGGGNYTQSGGGNYNQAAILQLPSSEGL